MPLHRLLFDAHARDGAPPLRSIAMTSDERTGKILDGPADPSRHRR
jgi:hypothetical protein